MAMPVDLVVADATLTGDAPFTLTLSAEATDPDLGAVLLTYTWGDGTSDTAGSGSPVVKTYDDPGVYAVAIVASDESDNTTAPTTLVVTVNPPLGLDYLDDDNGYCQDSWFDEPSCEFDDPELMDRCITAAIRWMFEATCGKYPGVCDAFIRPPSDMVGRCQPRSYRGQTTYRYDLTYGLEGPIREIVRVVVDGETVDPRFYRLANHRWLIAQTASGDDTDNPLIPLPTQDDDRPAGDENTWYVIVRYGQEVNELLKLATEQLACEFYKALTGDETCGFPDNASSVSQQGVSITFTPPAPRRTGIRSIDMVLDQFPGCDDRRWTTGRIMDPAAGRPEVTKLGGDFY